MNKIIHLLLGRRELVLKAARSPGGRNNALVTSQPQAATAEARRLRSAEGHGVPSGPRAGEQAGHSFELPLDTRLQTIVRHRLPAEDLAALDDRPPPANEGRDKR